MGRKSRPKAESGIGFGEGAVSPLSTSYGERSGLLSCRPVNGRIATVFQPARCKFFGIKIRKWRSNDFNEE